MTLWMTISNRYNLGRVPHLYYANAGISIRTSKPPWIFTERQQMSKWILGGALLTLGIIKLADMVQEQPSVGIPLAIVITILWIIQMEKDYRGARK